MQDYFIFDEKELVRIGVVCAACETESVFDLSRDQIGHTPRLCPGCNTELLPAFKTEAPSTYNWVTYYKKALDMKKTIKVGEKPAILRLYFKKPPI